MTKTMSAQSIRSPLTVVGASLLVPAPMALIPSYSLNKASAVGLRSRFSLQTKSRFILFFAYESFLGPLEMW